MRMSCSGTVLLLGFSFGRSVVRGWVGGRHQIEPSVFKTRLYVKVSAKIKLR